LQLVACGLKLVPLCEGLEACRLTLETLEAWGLLLEAWREWLAACGLWPLFAWQQR
jgi:hypothetical protein